MRRIFITGTDTDIGKTYVTCQLSQWCIQQGFRVANLKPIAAGAERVHGELRNQDALLLQQASNVELPYHQINPFCFQEAIAPHIAAERAGCALQSQMIKDALDIDHIPADIVFIEGAGGWRVPLSDSECMSELPEVLDCDVILVVGMRLGCLSHALLTIDSIQQRGHRLIGWVSNQLDATMSYYQDNLETLKRRISVPHMTEITYQQKQINNMNIFYKRTTNPILNISI